jgi:2-polyprenyl-3-methyl-5-hydroxy-6-metoxy-1,4-benzoquinol methylase
MSLNKKFISWEDAVRWLRDQKNKRQLVLDAYFDDPLIDAAKRYWQSSEWQEIRKIVGASSGKALDIGAGRGIASYALARDGFKVTALEPDLSNLVGVGAIKRLALESGLPIEVEQETSEKISSQKDNRFDLVFARAALHHMDDLYASCQECFRVLKPGGMFVAVREHVVTRKSDLKDFYSLHPLHGLYGGENAFMLEEYKAAIIRAGFRIERILKPLLSPINFSPYTLDTMCQKIVDQFSYFPGASGAVRILFKYDWALAFLMRILAIFDSRPGRLYSFVASKPEEGG